MVDRLGLGNLHLVALGLGGIVDPAADLHEVLFYSVIKIRD